MLPARIEAKISKDPGGCWEWESALSNKGYSLVWYEGRTRLAHRVVYEIVHGPIPPRLVIDHLCRNRACVNPSHMQLVTIGDNIRRGRTGKTRRRR